MSKRIFLITAIILICSCSKEPYDPDYNISLVVQNDSVTLYHHYRISKPGVSDFSFCDELPVPTHLLRTDLPMRNKRERAK